MATNRQPKTFSVALKDAETLLRQRKSEKKNCLTSLDFLNTEIPRLEIIIFALRGGAAPGSQGIAPQRPAGVPLSSADALAMMQAREVPEGAGFVPVVPGEAGPGIAPDLDDLPGIGGGAWA